MSVLEAIKYNRGSFSVLDQLKVPLELVYVPIESVDDAVKAISSMQVRGAPLIATVGTLSIAIELELDLSTQKINTGEELKAYMKEQITKLINARPTAVNMQREGHALIKFVEEIVSSNETVEALKLQIIQKIENMLEINVQTNKSIGKHGAEMIFGKYNRKVNILTHCNTGSLATVGIGTALGVIRTLFQNGNLEHTYFGETRPWNQGSRLTSFELIHDNIPSTMVCDSAICWLMKCKKIDAVVVGADRIIWNGDTANKIGTYQIALAAKAHGIPFYVAAPKSTIDFTVRTNYTIPIEERSSAEVTTIAGVQISPKGTNVWNPAFDVTSADLITGIITEDCVLLPSQICEYHKSNVKLLQE